MPDLRLPPLNTVTLAGRLTRDPELRYLDNGTPLCKLGLAVDDGYKGATSWVATPIFVDVACWKELAERVGELRKGDPVLVEGKLKFESWEGKGGGKQSKLTVTAMRVHELAWKEKNEADGYEHTPTPEANNDVNYVEKPDDGLPF